MAIRTPEDLGAHVAQVQRDLRNRQPYAGGIANGQFLRMLELIHHCYAPDDTVPERTRWKIERRAMAQ